MMSCREVVLSSGDPQGIGPEVTVKAVRVLCARYPQMAFVAVGGRGGLERAGAESWEEAPLVSRPGAWVLSSSEPTLLRLGAGPSAAGGQQALSTLRAALARVRSGPGRALCTAPVSKQAITESGTPFDGHTDWLAQATGAGPVVMLFVADSLRVALATVHVPLAEVSRRLTRQRVEETLRILRRGLQEHYGVADPTIDVLALNPHAGEGGLLGSEEGSVILPAMRTVESEGVRVAGPFPADSYFRPNRAPVDGILAMYHDQGLIPVKLLGFGKAVNVTLGLPIIRTSVDHGCAFDLAGQDRADPGSMVEAADHAVTLLARSGSSTGC